jgi:hypothetical protein
MEGEHIRNEIVPVLVLLQAAKRHLGAGDVLLGVLEVRELRKALANRKPTSRLGARWAYQSVVVPGDALLLVGVGVGVAINGTGLTAKQAVQCRADLVATVLLNGVALRAARLEEVGTLLDVTCGESRQLLFLPDRR